MAQPQLTEANGNRLQLLEHSLPAAWADHARQMTRQIQALEAKAFELEGRATAHRREMDLIRAHIGQVISTLVETERLPKSIEPYRLSQDCSKLVGITEAP